MQVLYDSLLGDPYIAPRVPPRLLDLLEYHKTLIYYDDDEEEYYDDDAEQQVRQKYFVWLASFAVGACTNAESACKNSCTIELLILWCLCAMCGHFVQAQVKVTLLSPSFKLHCNKQ